MKQDIILAGVGGQGILSIAFVIDNAALKDGLNFKQAEVHGMAQRGGAVQSHLRLSKSHIFSDLIPKGEADLIISIEPLESLRYVEYLNPDGCIITSTNPFCNIPDYPPIEDVLMEIRSVKKAVLIDSEKIAKKAGSSRAQNMVILGAASKYLMVGEEALMEFIKVLFRTRGENIVNMNLRAFQVGKEAAS